MMRCSELLDLIPKNRHWEVTKNGSENSVPEDEKLELTLGLPNGNHESGEFFLSSDKLFPFCSNIRNNCSNNKSGAKRALSDKAEGVRGDGNWLNRNDEFQPHKLISSQKTAEKVSPLTPRPSGCLPSSAFQRQAWKLSQQSKSSYWHHLLLHQKLDMVSEEPSKPCNLKTAEFPYLDGKACSNSVSIPADSSEPNSSPERVSVAPAVGWPPIRSFRKNLATRHSSKAKTLGFSNQTVHEDNGSKSDCCNGQMFVKVYMDGVPIGRKLNLQAYDNYEQLSSGIDELFHSLLAAQKDYLAAEGERNMEESKTSSDSKNENGTYTLVYYDNEGDRMLVGDVPWNMFVSTVKRLHVLKSSIIINTEMK